MLISRINKELREIPLFYYKDKDNFILVKKDVNDFDKSVKKEEITEVHSLAGFTFEQYEDVLAILFKSRIINDYELFFVIKVIMNTVQIEKRGARIIEKSKNVRFF